MARGGPPQAGSCRTARSAWTPTAGCTWPKDDALDEAPSLVDRRQRTTAMLPEADLPEMILKLMALYPQFPAAFTSISGDTSRLADLHVSVTALLTAHALNVGSGP